MEYIGFRASEQLIDKSDTTMHLNQHSKEFVLGIWKTTQFEEMKLG